MFGRSKRAAAAVVLATLVKTVTLVTVLSLVSLASPGRAAAAGPDSGNVRSGSDVVGNADDDALEIGQAVPKNGSTDDVRLYREEAAVSALSYGPAGLDPGSAIERVQDLLGVEFDHVDGMFLGTEWVDGALVNAVRPDSVAARGGVRGPRHVLHCALDVAIVAAGFFLPPLFVALPMIDEEQIGESQDLIIAVDGDRVRNAYDIDAHLRGLGPRDLIYLTVLRGRRRHQLRLAVGGEATP